MLTAIWLTLTKMKMHIDNMVENWKIDKCLNVLDELLPVTDTLLRSVPMENVVRTSAKTYVQIFCYTTLTGRKRKVLSILFPNNVKSFQLKRI